MLAALLLLGAAQLQQMRLPPIPTPVPAPIAEELSPAGEVTGLPDLVIGGIRIANADDVQFEVHNRGAATQVSVPLHACVYAGDRPPFCSRTITLGTLEAGASKWVRVNCFYRLARWDSDEAPICDIPDYAEKITKYSVVADGTDTPADDYFNRHGQLAPVALQINCNADYRCVQEIDETNNRKEFEGLDLVRIEPGQIRR